MQLIDGFVMSYNGNRMFRIFGFSFKKTIVFPVLFVAIIIFIVLSVIRQTHTLQTTSTPSRTTSVTTGARTVAPNTTDTLHYQGSVILSGVFPPDTNANLIQATPNYLLSIGYDGYLYLFNLQTQTEIGIATQVQNAIITPDQRYIIYAMSTNNQPGSGELDYFDLQTMHNLGKIVNLPIGANVLNMAYNSQTGGIVYTYQIDSQSPVDFGYQTGYVVLPTFDNQTAASEQTGNFSNTTPTFITSNNTFYFFDPSQSAIASVAVNSAPQPIFVIHGINQTQDIQNIDINAQNVPIVVLGNQVYIGSTSTPVLSNVIHANWLDDNNVAYETTGGALSVYNVLSKKSQIIADNVINFVTSQGNLFYEDRQLNVYADYVR